MSPRARHIRRFMPRILTPFALVALAGCASVTPISDLLANPSHYDGKTVRVAGNVQRSAGLLGEGAYELNDGTGTIAVVSQVGTPPPKGTRVGVKGTFQSLFTLLSRSLAVIKEESRFTP